MGNQINILTIHSKIIDTKKKNLLQKQIQHFYLSKSGRKNALLTTGM